MKRNRLLNLSTALVATGVFLGRGAHADTTLDFNTVPPYQTQGNPVEQIFGDSVTASSEGIVVSGFGTPNINLTWQGTGAGDTRWDFYNDGGSVWSAGQLNDSAVGFRHELVFAPNAPQAAAIIKSFNFHPYYLLPKDLFTYRISVVNSGGATLSGPITNAFSADGISSSHLVSLNYTGAIGQTIILRLERIASTLPNNSYKEGGAYDIAVDDIVFAQTPETEFSIGPEVLSVSPVNGAVSVAPDHLYLASITNRTTSIVTNTIQLKINGTPLSPTIVSNSGLTTVSYASPSLLPSGSTNKYTLIYGDNSSPTPKSYTNEVTYVVAQYENKLLPAPIVLENFDSTPEGSLPAGWTATTRDTVRDPASDPTLNLANLDSAAYTNWTVVDVSRFTGLFETYSQGVGTPPGEASDFQRVLSINPSNVLNGQFLREFASGRMAFANTGYRLDALGQILILVSPDFNLSSQGNVHLAFRSLWEQNQDSMAAVEYSVDMGATWLPALYMLQGSDVFTNLDGSIDGLKTFTNVTVGGFEGIAQWVEGGVTNGGYYGAFIGVASNLWGTLGPYISRRVDDNAVGSKRVEILRLPMADNQPNVRLRFVTAGTDSWYWGIDNVGLYSLAGFQITSITKSGGSVVINWPGEATARLQQSTTVSPTNWQDVSGTLGASSAIIPMTNSASFFRLAKPNSP
jgi:hypothetical protein